MRIVFLGHACHLVEIDGVRILTDPWLADPIFEGLVEHDLPLAFGPGDLPPIDAIALTHGHLDHFNAPTLAALPDKSIPVVHPPSGFTELDGNLRLLGFTNLVERRDYEPFTLGSVRVIPTPSLGVLDECAYLIEGHGGRFWNGADAPQPAAVVEQIAARYAPIDLGAFSHNSFDQPTLIGLPSMKNADHGPEGACRSARILHARAALPAASSMRWCGPGGSAITAKVIRRSPQDFRSRLAIEAPEIIGLDLQPGDGWSRAAGVERGVIRGASAPRTAHDYIHNLLATGARWCPAGVPSTEETFRRDLPVLTAARSEAARQLGQRVYIEVSGDDPGGYTVDFGTPGAVPCAGDDGAPFALRILDTDWKALFERTLNWQVVTMADRMAVSRFRPGAPPDGLNFVYALQGIFP